MRKELLIVLLALFPELQLRAADGEIFTAHTIEGIDMTFKVISEKAKTCQVGIGNYPETAISKDTRGLITIPSEVNRNGVSYSVTAIANYAFVDCSDITSVTIGNRVTTIGVGAFWNCTGLVSATIGNGVTTIDRAFTSCFSMKTLIIGNSVTTIDDFESCNLDRIVCTGVTPPARSEFGFMFSSTNKKMCKLYVPAGTISSYQTAEEWNEFLFIREGIYTSPDEGEDIVIDAWDGVAGYSEYQFGSSCDFTPTISPLWVDNIDTSWGIPNNCYACFSPINNAPNISVTYHSDEVIAGEHYKLKVFFAPETREGMSQLPCRVNITTSYGENDMDLTKDYSVSGTEVTVFETDDITFPQNSFDLTVETRVSAAQIRRNDFIRVFRIAKIQLIRETTGVSSLGQSNNSAIDCYYTIDSRKIIGKPTKRGLYIRNGKKMWVR